MKCRQLPKQMSIVLLLALLISLWPLSFVAAASETGTVNAKVIMRESASKNAKSLQTLPVGEEVAVLGTSGSFYRVRYGSFTGYIMMQYVDLASHSVIANQSAIDALGDTPGALYIGDEGTDVKTLQGALKILGYYDLRIDGIYGNGTTAAVAMYQQAFDLEADGIAGKRTIRSIFGSCASKADITVSGRDSTTKSDTESSTGNSSDVKSDKNVVNSFAEIGSAPDATEEGDSGKDVVKLQQALHLLGYYTGVIDGDYGAKTTAAVTRFQKNRGMHEDGIAGAGTIRVLFGGVATKKSSASSSSSASSTNTKQTLTLDWFADKVTNLIPKNAKFTIKDVRTGKTFTAVRWSGTNHLDAEPATAEDTAVFKRIYRGSWSWSRRPVLILYRNRVYAASMNGMPHGTTTISDNDFDGHFCIHFKNSKTHETDQLDSEHQSAVTVASKATW